MALTLEKKESLTLDKNEELTNLKVEVEWDTPKIVNGPKFDVDLTAFICENRKIKDGSYAPQVISQEHTCFHMNPVTADKALRSSGDALGEDGKGYEAIDIDTDLLDSRAVYIPFILTIDKADKRRQNFGMVKGGGVKITNTSTNEVLAEFSWGNGAYTDETAIHLATLERTDDGSFKFTREDAAGIKSLAQIGSEDYGF